MSVCSFTYNNMSSLCNESQYYAINALLGSSPPSHIASFGNTSVENVAGWIPIYRNLTSPACSVGSSQLHWFLILSAQTDTVPLHRWSPLVVVMVCITVWCLSVRPSVCLSVYLCHWLQWRATGLLQPWRRRPILLNSTSERAPSYAVIRSTKINTDLSYLLCCYFWAVLFACSTSVRWWLAFSCTYCTWHGICVCLWSWAKMAWDAVWRWAHLLGSVDLCIRWGSRYPNRKRSFRKVSPGIKSGWVQMWM